MLNQSILQLASSHRLADLKSQYEKDSRIQIRNFLAPGSAEAVYRCLSGQTRWNIVFNDAGKHVDANAAAIDKWPSAARKKLQKGIYAQASHDFQYNYCAIPIYDIYRKKLLPGDFLNEVFEFLNSKDFINFVQEITGDPSIDFADAQATLYKGGHFLTKHDDCVDGKNRRAGYVLNMSRGWRTDWGGALQFFDSEGNIERAYTPTFNALNLFRVPTEHSVGFVAPFAATDRLSITGWLRSGADPLAC